MQIQVFLDMGDAIAVSSDSHGLLPVEVELDKLSQVQREMLANLVNQPRNPAYVQNNVRLAGGGQEYAPRVRRPGLAGLLEALDDMVLALQQKAHLKEKLDREAAARQEQSLVRELAEARKWSRQYSMRQDEQSEAKLVRWYANTVDTRLECPVCGRRFEVEEIYLSAMANLLTENVQESIKELAMDRRIERLVCGFDRHVAGCKAKAETKKLLEGELQALFVTYATDEQMERFHAGFVGDVELRQTVAKALFKPMRGLAGVAEDYVQYGRVKDVQTAERIEHDEIQHEEYCETDKLNCRIKSAQYLSSEQFRFFQLVKAAYRGPQGFAVKQEARFVCCDCNQCEGYLVGFHVLVTLTSPLGQEFSRRFEPVDRELARFVDAATFNDHWSA